MKRVFVTGATGLLGSNLVRALLAQGYQVTAQARSESKARRMLGDCEVEWVYGDLENLSDWIGQIRGCEQVYHTAAYFREYFQPGDHWGLLKKYNIDATLELMQAADAAGVSRFAYISSSGVIDAADGTEQSRPNPHAKNNLYFKSKVLADAAVADFVRQHRLEVVSILPGWMIGPGDGAPTASGRLLLDFVKGKLPGYFNAGTSTVDARDVALACITAAERGQAGERYIIGGRFVSMQTLTETLARVSGLPALRRKLPNAAVLTVAWFAQNWGRLTGQPALMTTVGVGTLMQQHRVHSDKAIRELGVSFRPLDETLADALHWFQQQGMLPDDSAPALLAARSLSA